MAAATVVEVMEAVAMVVAVMVMVDKVEAAWEEVIQAQAVRVDAAMVAGATAAEMQVAALVALVVVEHTASCHRQTSDCDLYTCCCRCTRP